MVLWPCSVVAFGTLSISQFAEMFLPTPVAALDLFVIAGIKWACHSIHRWMSRLVRALLQKMEESTLWLFSQVSTNLVRWVRAVSVYQVLCILMCYCRMYSVRVHVLSVFVMLQKYGCGHASDYTHSSKLIQSILLSTAERWTCVCVCVCLCVCLCVTICVSV